MDIQNIFITLKDFNKADISTGENSTDFKKDSLSKAYRKVCTNLQEGYMSHFPFYINTKHLQILIVGAGNIALRRTKALLPFFDRITVLSKDFKEEFFLLPKEKIHFIQKKAEEKDLSPYNTIIVCTDDSELNYKIYQWTLKQNKLVNLCDRPDLCSFYFPSIIKDNETTISISSGGDKKTTKRIRKHLNQFFKNEVPYD